MRKRPPTPSPHKKVKVIKKKKTGQPNFGFGKISFLGDILSQRHTVLIYIYVSNLYSSILVRAVPELCATLSNVPDLLESVTFGLPGSESVIMYSRSGSRYGSFLFQ